MLRADIEPLFEREQELSRLTASLESARSGRGRVLVIEGPPGIGKTSLLEALDDAATRDGFEVLGARGGDLERDLPFGVVRQLFELRLHRAGSDERAALLNGAGELLRPMLLEGGEASGGVSADRSYAVLHGLYWLTSNLAEQAPLLLAVDDAHWADAPSLRFLHYLVRRVDDLPVLMVMALRPTEPESRAELTARLRTDPLAILVHPAPLSRAAVATVIGERLGGEPAKGFCDACYSATRGNPFLLRELITELIADGIEPSAQGAARVARMVPEGVTRHALARLMNLPADAADLARAVAVLGTEVELRLAGELAGLDESAAGHAADELARAELLRRGAPLEFVHPLIREAIYADMPRAQRALAHGRAARLLNEAGAPPDRVAAQLLVTAPAAERWAVAALRAAASEALERGGPESAATYLRRALEEPLGEELRAEVLFELGSAEALVEGPAASARLTEALVLTQEPERRAAIAALLARRLFYEGGADEAQAVCGEALAGLEGANPELRARLEAELLLNSMTRPGLLAVAGELTARGLRARDAEGFGAKALLAEAAWVGTLAGMPAAAVAARAERALAGGALLSEDNGGPAFICTALVLAVADSELAPDVCTAGLRAARATGNGFAFATNKTFTSRVRLFRGELSEAIADGTEGLEACEAYEIAIGPNYAGAFLAEALIASGDLDGGELVLERVNAPAEVPDTAHWHPFLEARSELLLLRGEPRRALAETLECGRRYAAVGASNPGWIAWRSRAALCLTALEEDPARAQALAGEEVELAGGFGAPRALGRALRVNGLVLGGREGLRSLRDAVDVLEDSPARLELAHALCDLGATLRHEGQRQASREPLRRAVEAAHACGAIALEERAHQELLASGARPRRRPVGGVDALTPTEHRVAAMAAEGLSNRAIAQDLFVSLKTVETHLSRAYRKLDLRSRTELPAALGSPQ